MGDRCYVMLIVRNSDRDKVCKIIGDAGYECPAGTGCVELQYHDANYALDTELTELCDKQIPYYTENEAGDEYPAGAAVYVGGKSEPIATALFDGRVAVTVDEKTGNVPKSQLRYAQRFIKAKKKFCEKYRDAPNF